MKASTLHRPAWQVLFAMAGLLAVSTAAAATIHVSPAGNDGNDGLSWATAKKTVQAGLDTAATAGGEVWVRAGTYSESITLAEGVHLYGGFAGVETQSATRDWTRNVTVLDGGNVTGVMAVVTASGLGLATSTVDGFTIRNGLGGGIYCQSASPTIANNIITANGGGSCGGAIYCTDSSPIIMGNRIAGNNAFGIQGALSSTPSSPTITNNAITSNTFGGIAWSSPGAGLVAGNTIKRNGVYGGISWNSGSPTIRNNTINANTGPGIWCGSTSAETMMITGNTITGNGGGINVGGAVAILSNLVAGNSVTGEYGYGGGICCNNGSLLTIANNVITGNTASVGGGGISCAAYSGGANIANNTVAYNTAPDGGGIHCFGASLTIANTIVAFNSSGIYGTGAAAPSLRYNCVFGNAGYAFFGMADPTGSNGNITGDPRLLRPASAGDDGVWGTADDDYGDLRLLPGSPCIDAGSNADALPYPSSDFILHDCPGGSRFLDDPCTADTGAGTPPIVDMGAYEYCCGDVDGDGYVDVEDLLYFVDSFGTVKGDGNYDARCDFNVDDAVDVADLLTLVLYFGV